MVCTSSKISHRAPDPARPRQDVLIRVAPEIIPQEVINTTGRDEKTRVEFLHICQMFVALRNVGQ